MTEEHYTENEKLPGSTRTSARNEKSQSSPKRQRSPLDWDFEPYFLAEPNVNHSGRLRASSWDDSDDNLQPIPDTSGSKTCRIYTSDDKKPKTSVANEIDELKKQFFLAREKEEKMEENSPMEPANEELEGQLTDRRLSPARIRRRSRSSGSSSPVLEMENPISPMQTNKSSGSDTEFQDASSNIVQYDPTFYLNHFFTELKSRRISLVDPLAVIESIEKDIPKYDSDTYNEICALDGKDANPYLCKTPRVLPQILEVEENRKDLQKLSEENLPSSFLQQCFGNDEVSSLPTTRSRKSEKSTEVERKIQNDRYKSLSSEHLRTQQNPQNVFHGSLTERCHKFFDGKLDQDFISLSAKTGKTQLALPKCVDERENTAPVQLFCVMPPNGDDKDVDHLEDEANDTPTKSTDRSQQSRRSVKSENFKAESPKFILNLGRDSARSLKADDVDDFQRKENTEECSFRKTTSEDGSQPKTDRIPPISIKSPSVESVISTMRSSKEEEVVTTRSKNENSSQRSHKKSRKTTSCPPSEERITPQTRHSPRESQKPSPVDRSQRTSRKSSAKSLCKDVENGTTTPNSKSTRISKSPRTKTPKTGSTCTPRSNKIPELSLPIDIGETPESQRASSRSVGTVDTTRKDSDRSETRQRSYRTSDRSTGSKSKPTGSPRRLQMTPKTNGSSSRRSKNSLQNPNEIESGRTHSGKESEKVCDAVSYYCLTSSANSWREAEIPSQHHSYRSDVHNSDEMENTSKQQLSRSRNSSRISVNSNITETEGKSPKQSHCTAKESPSPSERTHRSCHSEEDREDEEEENVPESHAWTQRSKTGDESDRLSHKRLSVINEVSFEDLETSNVSTESEENDTQGERRPSTRQHTNRTSPERTSNDGSVPTGFLKPEKEEWNKLINEFHKSPKSFVLDKFPGFPPEKDVAWNASEYVEKKMDGCECDENSEESSFSRHKTQKARSLEKSMSKNLNDLVYPDSLSDKTKQGEFVQNSQNIYYVNVGKGGPFGIGEFGDVTCWNAGDFDTKDLDKPKDHGDGIGVRATEVRLLEKELKTQSRNDFRGSTSLLNNLSQEAADDEDFSHHIPCRLKPSKSDNCINKKVSGGDECQISEPSLNGSHYKSETTDVLGFEENRNANEGKITSKSTINQSSSTESLGSGKDWENLEFAYERTPRLSRSLSNLDVRVRENMYDRIPSETLSVSGSELFRRPGDTPKQQKESTLHSYLSRRAEEEKKTGKSGNWLKLKHTDAKHSTKKSKTKFTKKSKEPFHDYLSSRKGRAVVPALKLRNANCFQNFYKRVISVFCLTSSSSAATSK